MSDYRFVYLANYAINAFLVWAIIILTNLNIVDPSILDTLYVCTASMATFMFLSLWGHGFRANDSYKGKRALSSRPTICFSLSLLIIEAMVIYGFALGHTGFQLPSIVGMAVWSAAIITAIFFAKNFIISNCRIADC